MVNFTELYAQLPKSPLRHYPLSTIKAWLKYIDLTQSTQAVMVALIDRAREEEEDEEED